MLDRQSFPNCTSQSFEKIAIQRFRSLAMCIPPDCRVFREPWGCSTVVCLDFQSCPGQLTQTKSEANVILGAARHLGLANSVTFRIGNQVIGWT